MTNWLEKLRANFTVSIIILMMYHIKDTFFLDAHLLKISFYLSSTYNEQR